MLNLYPILSMFIPDKSHRIIAPFSDTSVAVIEFKQKTSESLSEHPHTDRASINVMIIPVLMGSYLINTILFAIT